MVMVTLRRFMTLIIGPTLTETWLKIVLIPKPNHGVSWNTQPYSKRRFGDSIISQTRILTNIIEWNMWYYSLLLGILNCLQAMGGIKYIIRESATKRYLQMDLRIWYNPFLIIRIQRTSTVSFYQVLRQELGWVLYIYIHMWLYSTIMASLANDMDQFFLPQLLQSEFTTDVGMKGMSFEVCKAWARDTAQKKLNAQPSPGEKSIKVSNHTR